MIHGRPDRAFFSVDAETLARRLLGQRLVRVLESGERLAGVIVETEAYIGVKDRASHAFGGRRTDRTESMYADGGTAYVYFTYGMHNMFNVVCGGRDEPLAVLVRALRPIEGLATMMRHRSRSGRLSGRLRETDLCSGPGKLCDALGIDRSLDRIDLTTDPRLFIERARSRALTGGRVVRTARIGVESAGQWAAAPLRWLVRDDPNVSRTQAGVRAVSGGARPPTPDAASGRRLPGSGGGLPSKD